MIVLLCYLANMSIAMLSAGFAAYITLGSEPNYEEEYESLFLPVLVGFIISFMIAKVMLSVWDAAATTGIKIGKFQ